MKLYTPEELAAIGAVPEEQTYTPEQLRTMGAVPEETYTPEQLQQMGAIPEERQKLFSKKNIDSAFGAAKSTLKSLPLNLIDPFGETQVNARNIGQEPLRPAKAVGHGVGQFVSGSGGTADWLGMPGVADVLHKVGNAVQDKTLIENPTILDKTLMGIGTSLPAFVPGIGATRLISAARLAPKIATIAGISVNTALESLTEAGFKYDEAVQAGKTPQEANATATKTFFGNAALLPFTNKLSGLFDAEGKGILKSAVRAAPFEGLEEGGQQIVGNVAAGARDLAGVTAGVGESVGIGTLAGGMLGAGVGAIRGNTKQAAQPVTPPLAAPIESAAQQIPLTEAEYLNNIQQLQYNLSRIEQFKESIPNPQDYENQRNYMLSMLDNNQRGLAALKQQQGAPQLPAPRQLPALPMPQEQATGPGTVIPLGNMQEPLITPLPEAQQRQEEARRLKEIPRPHRVIAIDADTGAPIIKMGEPEPATTRKAWELTKEEYNSDAVTPSTNPEAYQKMIIAGRGETWHKLNYNQVKALNPVQQSPAAVPEPPAVVEQPAVQPEPAIVPETVEPNLRITKPFPKQAQPKPQAERIIKREGVTPEVISQAKQLRDIAVQDYEAERPGNLIERIVENGFIKHNRAYQEMGDIKYLPLPVKARVFTKNETAQSLDEMAQMLGMTDVELLRELANAKILKKPSDNVNDYIDQALAREEEGKQYAERAIAADVKEVMQDFPGADALQEGEQFTISNGHKYTVIEQTPEHTKAQNSNLATYNKETGEVEIGPKILPKKAVEQIAEQKQGQTKEPWEMTRGEYFKKEYEGDFTRKTQSDKFHKMMTKDALSKGKPVPAEVLADYPDLVKEQPSLVETEQETINDRISRYTKEARAAGMNQIQATKWAKEKLEREAKPKQRAEPKAEQSKFVTDGVQGFGDGRKGEKVLFRKKEAKDQTETPAFKEWFGNSKVVDGNGKPLVVYHGTYGNFTEFDKKKVGKNYKDLGYRRGFFFDPNPENADITNFDIKDEKTANSMPVYLRINNPLIVHMSRGQKIPHHWATVNNAASWYDNNVKEIMREASQQKKDGIIVINDSDTFDKLFIAFEPTQIKSATGNRGTFDPTNPDIRYREGVATTTLTPAQKSELLKIAESIKLPGEQFSFVSQIENHPEALAAFVESANRIMVTENQTMDEAVVSLFHEKNHQWMRLMMTDTEYADVIDFAKNKHKAELDKMRKEDGEFFDEDAAAEEIAAEIGAQYSATHRGLIGKIKAIFDRIINRIKEFFGYKDKIKSMADAVEQRTAREYARNPNVEMEQAFREKPMDEKRFYANYYQHKILRDNPQEQIRLIKENGFKQGIGPNAMMASNGKPDNIIQMKYSPKKGETVLLIPKEYIEHTPNGPKIKNGWKPKDNEIVVVERDNQPMYELYNKKSNPDIQFRKRTPEQQGFDSLYDNEGMRPIEKMFKSAITPLNKKVHFFDYFRTPIKVLEKIGLGNEAKRLRMAFDAYKLELPKNIEKIIAWRDGLSKESNEKIFKWLDGDRKVELNKKEYDVAGEIKEWLSEWADRLHLPEDRRITDYITHIFDEELIKKEFDEELAKIITYNIAGSVYDPFMMERKGMPGYKEDVWQALDAYVKRATRKAHLDPVLKDVQKAAENLEISQWKYVKNYIDRVQMRPTDIDNEIDNFIKQIPGVGYKLGQRPSTVILKEMRRWTYRAKLGLNLSTYLRNLSQATNTYAVLGEKYTAIGYMKLFNSGAVKELEQEGILEGGFIEDQRISAVKKAIESFDKVLFFGMQASETINRGAAYFGAKAKAVAEGKNEKEAIYYAKSVVNRTQFKFDAVDQPVRLGSDIVKTAFQLQTYTVKQIEFLTEMAKNKEFAGLFRYALLGILFTASIGKIFGMKWEDLIPSFRFGLPPSMKLPGQIAGAVFNAPDKYGRERTFGKKMGDISKEAIGYVPASSQATKTFGGIKAVKEGGFKTGKKKLWVNYTPAKATQAVLFGKYASPEARKHFDKKRGK